MIKDFVAMLNFFLKWGQANHLTPTFIIEPFFVTTFCSLKSEQIGTVCGEKMVELD
jgi:hypothetical protein